MIWFICIAVMILSYAVQSKLDNRFRKYSNVANHSGLTGAQVAAKMLGDNNIHDVEIVETQGHLTDHYNPKTRTVNLSREVYESSSIAAAAVAAHECGHVLQHYEGYAPLKLRSLLVPVVNFANMTVQWILILGIILIESIPQVFWLGIALFAMTTLFSVITLPVEINASQRATTWLERAGIADDETLPMAKDALKWAAYTYVIAAIGSIATLIYYIAAGSRRS